jgi:hypothetical protein
VAAWADPHPAVKPYRGLRTYTGTYIGEFTDGKLYAGDLPWEGGFLMFGLLKRRI